MRILLFSDTHGLNDPIKRINQTKVDAIIHAGDMSDFGKYHEPFFEACSKSGSPLFFVSGNHECPNLCDDVMMDYPGVKCVDGRWLRHGGLNIFGVIGYDIFSDGRQVALEAELETACTNVMGGFSILVSHEPPWPWYMKQRPTGSPMISRFINTEIFQLVVVGHLHERQMRLDDKHFKAPVINPGPRGCVVDVDLETKKFTWY